MQEYIRKRQGPIDSILKEIHDFKHDVAMPASFAVSLPKDFAVSLILVLHILIIVVQSLPAGLWR